MRKIVSGLLMGLLFVGCAKQETTYTIQGEWKGGDGKVIYLKKDLGNKQYEVLDSAIVANGVFKMQKPLGDVDERILQIDGSTNIVILDSVPIQVKCENVKKTVRGKEKESVKIEISGSVEQDIFKTVLLAQRDEMMIMLGLSFMGKEGKENSGMVDSLAQIYIAMKAKTEKTIDSLVTNYPDCHASALIINNFVVKNKDLAEVERMYDGLTPRIKNAYLGRKLKATIDNIKKTSLGNVAPDFTLQAPDGKNVSLADFRGKYVLLDFWASWCGPCLREVPNVKKVYDKYHDKGFEILSVSLDDKKDNWTNAIEKYDLNWVHVSSLQGWDCPVAKLYNVSGVPAMLLIDKEGKIIATKLRGELLMEKVAEQFGE
ncbi:TlpA disulfide reductase family protein [Odoribacter sp. AF15-53]|uniref:TlpA disulfide reductase family protein n=1 Tax=Odoribacter sp. AF15-53 TaxID=2292236 RepID=UPI000E46A3A3|nr:TlpA disulfide reductase family protein [Odoribacter sp. AF15-53]RHR73867.1 AhpC/TSA family protein [Odoribacter sp. AF15-53]